MSSTVTFLFTDIEDSTRLWDAQPARMAAVLARHDALCRGVVAEARGRVVKTTGDGLYAAFEDPFEALSAAIELQRGVQALARESDLALKMRCGLHCGAAEARDGDYFGPAVNCAARVMDAAHGGQVLVTQAVVDRAGGRHPEGADLLHLGRMRLRGVASPVDMSGRCVMAIFAVRFRRCARSTRFRTTCRGTRRASSVERFKSQR